MKYISTYFLLVLILASSCSQDSDPIIRTPGGGGQFNEWSVPIDEVRNGGPGKDGIPSIDAPIFEAVSSIRYMNDNDLVLLFKDNNGVVKAYTHPVLDWHEIVNDEIDGKPIALTYCPLTGTGIGWDRMIDGQETEFGVSGLLYNTNLMPYDRRTNSTWSQQRLDCVNGPLIGKKIKTYSFVETTWATLKAFYPDAMVLSTETGFNREYGNYPYGPYRTSESTIFPVSNIDTRLHPKERVLGVILDPNITKAYPFANSGEAVDYINDTIGGQDFLIARSTSYNFIVAFPNPAERQLMPLRDQLPAVVQDSEGNTYDILGHPIRGDVDPIILPPQFIGYWISWGAFYPNIDLY